MNAKTPRPASIERDDAASTDHIEDELRRYDAYLRDLRGLSPGSRRHDLRIAGQGYHCVRNLEAASLMSPD